MPIDSFDHPSSDPLVKWVFSNYDSLDVQKKRIELLQNQLLEIPRISQVHICSEFAIDILNCVQHCKSALSVLEHRIITSVTGRVLLGYISNEKEDFYKEEWLEVEVRRGTVDLPSIKSENKEQDKSKFQPSAPTYDVPRAKISSDMQEWFVYINPGINDEELEELCKTIANIEGALVSEKKQSRNFAYCVVQLPRSNVTESVGKISKLSKHILGIETNMSGHMKSL